MTVQIRLLAISFPSLVILPAEGGLIRLFRSSVGCRQVRADSMIGVATAHLPKADQGFLAVFSASYFPDAQIVLDWVREGGGNLYRRAEKGPEGWFCPALLRCFQQAPANLYGQVKAGG